MTALQYLRNKYQERQRQDFPNVPAHALTPKPFNDRSANGLTRCIIEYLKLHGHQAERVSVEGRIIDQRQTFTDVIGRTRTIGSLRRVKTSAQRGSADISAIISGRAVKIEVKYSRDKQSEDQKQYQRTVEGAGGIYIIVHTLEDFHNWYNTFITTI